MAAVEVPQTLEYRGGQLNAAPILEVEYFINWKKRFMCHITGIEPQFENIISNGPYIPMAAGQRKPKTQWTPEERKDANLDQYKALMNELVNDGIKLLKLEINTGFINGLPKKWLAFYQSLKNTNHVKEYELASLFGKLKYEENLIKNIYNTNKEKTLVPATSLSTAFFSTSIVQDFQDSPDDEEDTRSSQEYLNDLKEEYQARALLAKSKRFFKKGTQRFSSAKATDQTECHKCGKNGHFARLLVKDISSFMLSVRPQAYTKVLIAKTYDWYEEEVSSNDNEVTEVKALMALTVEERVSSLFQPKILHSSEHKPEPRHTKDFEAKYNKVKAKLGLLSLNASAFSSSSGKNKVLIAETYDWYEEEVSSNDNEVTEVKALMALADEERVSVSK
ncbi:hypothetical protein Tco_1017681 [Tanacetum coccineum]|uniref:CCHC-type domain-containing protein n=1 Tax=Tanacetum coccineum TaxID=301880 RepID=A0ABQ5FS69_9ASTR